MYGALTHQSARAGGVVASCRNACLRSGAGVSGWVGSASDMSR
jgi:hypothetical protein